MLKCNFWHATSDSLHQETKELKILSATSKNPASVLSPFEDLSKFFMGNHILFVSDQSSKTFNLYNSAF